MVFWNRFFSLYCPNLFFALIRTNRFCQLMDSFQQQFSLYRFCHIIICAHSNCSAYHRIAVDRRNHNAHTLFFLRLHLFQHPDTIFFPQNDIHQQHIRRAFLHHLKYRRTIISHTYNYHIAAPLQTKLQLLQIEQISICNDYPYFISHLHQNKNPHLSFCFFRKLPLA